LGLLLLIGAYVAVYALSYASLDRYAAGFILNTCPVCGTGQLEIEERPYRSLGVPRQRRTVHCSDCRSILREVGFRRWRYAVDPHANPALFAEHNGDILNEAQLRALGSGGQGAPMEYTED
jgi:hypothetical protein